MAPPVPPLLWGVLLLALLGLAEACTVILAGRLATTDGNPMVAGTDDAGPSPNDIRLVKVPAMHHAPGAKRAVYPSHGGRGGYPRLVSEERGPYYEPRKGQALTKPLGYIPQVKYTYGYFENKYGLMNDVGLGVGESTCGAKTYGWATDRPGGRSMFGITELIRVALERCRTARCAVQMMGDLAVEHGFYGDGAGTAEAPVMDGASESAGIVDSTGEAWLFHVLTGPGNSSAVWAARRIPEKEVTAVPNGFVIRKVDLNDTDNYLASSNVQSFAQDMGWWQPSEGPFDFTAAYANFDNSPARALSVGRRLWRIFDLLAPSLHLDQRLGYAQRPTYPFSVTPDQPVNTSVLKRILRDHYEGTNLDLTKGVAAGPFGNPVRFGGSQVAGGWERAISMYRALYSHIAVSRTHHPEATAGVLWFGYDAPHGTVYVPLYGGQARVPPSYSVGQQSEFSAQSAYWAFCLLNNWIQLKWSYMIKEVQAQQASLEAAAEAKVKQWDRKALRRRPKDEAEDAVGSLEKATCAFAEEVVSQRWELTARLIAKYSNGNILVGEGPRDMTVPGYPVAWLNTTEYAHWPGNTWLPDSKVKWQHLQETGGWSQDLLVLAAVAVSLTTVLFLYSRHAHRAYQPL